MLAAAGVAVEAIAPNVDEDALKEGLRSEGVTARNLADALAEAMLDKPVDPADAIAHLKLLSGRKHKLFSAAVIAEQGIPVWRHVDSATLSVRPLSESFIEQYVESEWDHIRHCVGCYEIEGRGVQLFSSITGSQFTIMGLPLLHLLDYLRLRSILPA